MTPEEFRAARAAAGWTIRSAAAALGVAPSTIQRWESGGGSISAEAAERLSAASGQTSASHRLGYACGGIAAVLNWITDDSLILHPGLIETASEHPARAMPRIFALAHQQQHARRRHEAEGDLATLMQAIPSSGWPADLDEEGKAAWWLGYYHGKADRRSETGE